MSLFLASCLLFGLVLVELVLIRYTMDEQVPWLEIINNLNSGHILFWVCRGFELMAFKWVLEHLSIGWVGEWPVVLQWIFTIFAWDFCFYVLHFTHHKVPFLWSFHSVHHEGEHYSLSLGIRNAWFSSLTQFPFFVVLAILGIPMGVYLVVSSAHFFIQFWNHNRVLKDKKSWLDHVLVTPAVHHVHHAKNPEYMDKNCGGTFAIWDKLFGTYQAELPDVPIQLGIHEHVKAENPFWVNSIPILKWLKMPALIGVFERKSVLRLNEFFVAMGGFLLFGLLLFYVKMEPEWPGWRLSVLFALVFFGTIANGGLGEGKAWATWLWVVLTTVGSGVVVAVLNLKELWHLALFFGFAMHGIVTLGLQIYQTRRFAQHRRGSKPRRRFTGQLIPQNAR